ncbi:hypothetical protein E4K10_30700 [Streptomyces sp. T1317-0309]|nr:hypothetical protein E4K10_30700 [Streptomyces sp. T1317-0309]
MPAGRHAPGRRHGADCSGNTQQTGWLNLTTGAFTTGVPPAGAAACGDSRSITVSGVFCDITDDGVVHGLVLVEYHYDDAGAIDSVRLVDAATGATYTLRGIDRMPDRRRAGRAADPPADRRALRVRRRGRRRDRRRPLRRAVVGRHGRGHGTSPRRHVRGGDFDQPYTPVAPVDCAALSDESPGEPAQTCSPQIVERCGCDDTTGDGTGDVRYIEFGRSTRAPGHCADPARIVARRRLRPAVHAGQPRGLVHR